MILAYLILGFTAAANLFLISAGLNIIFGLLRVVNFAHASLYALGAYFAYTISLRFDNFWLGMLASVLLVGAIGVFIELVLLRRIYRREHIYQLLLTFAVILIITDLTKMFWGANPRMMSGPPILSGNVSFLGITIPLYCFFIIGFGAVVGFALWFLLYGTKWGTIIRASAFNREMASAMGVNVPRLFTFVFALGAGLAGLGGALAGLATHLIPDMGMLVIIECFAVIIIGGVGSLLGAAAGALIIGLWSAFGLLIVPRFSMVFTFALMAIVLSIRPWGIFGAKE